MRPRPSIVVAVASGLAGLVPGLTLGRPSAAQVPAPASAPHRPPIPSRSGDTRSPSLDLVLLMPFAEPSHFSSTLLARRCV